MSKCKVFCGACKYSKVYEGWGATYGCKKYRKDIQTPIHSYSVTGECEEINKDNDCEGYEEDWTVTVKRKIVGFFK